MKAKRDFAVGDKVFAKVKGYPPWPAIIDEVKGKRYSVTFYGTKETSKLKIEDLSDYLENRDKISPKYSKKKGFLESIRELEEELSGTANSATLHHDNFYQKNGQFDTDEHSDSNNDDDDENITLNNEDESILQQASPAVVVVAQKRKNRSTSSQSDELPKAKRPALAVSRKSSTASNVSVQHNKTDSPADGEYFESNLEIDESRDDDGNDNESTHLSDQKSGDKKSSGRPYDIVFSDELWEKIKNVDQEKSNDKFLFDNDRPKVLIARNQNGEFIGIKYERDKPISFDSDAARIQWMYNTIKSALRYKSQIESGEIEAKEIDIIKNPQLTVEERLLAIEKSVVRRKQERLKWLQLESKLVEYDSEIKTYLGLERADIDRAVNCLEQIHSLPVEQLMVTKHPHVFDMVKRLRRYIGNIRAWNLTPEQISDFEKGAEKIRNKADEVYQKFKALYMTEDNSNRSFFEIYDSYVKDFNLKTKNMKEAQRFAVCAKPGTKQFERDQMDDQLEIEAIKLKNELENKKTNEQDSD